MGRQCKSPKNLVFTDEVGTHLMPHTVYHNYKKVVASIVLPNAYSCNLRHTSLASC